jgi:hypothetical protein
MINHISRVWLLAIGLLVLAACSSTVYAVPAQGRGPNGQQVGGFAFEVKHSGTYPLGGIPKAKAVLADVVAGADRLVKNLPPVE